MLRYPPPAAHPYYYPALPAQLAPLAWYPPPHPWVPMPPPPPSLHQGLSHMHQVPAHRKGSEPAAAPAHSFRREHEVDRVIHYNVGFLAGTLAPDQQTYEFNTFRVPLPSTAIFFGRGDAQPWAREYDKAQAIFNSGYGALMRAGMRSAEEMLFGRMGLGQRMKVRVRTGRQLLEMLKGGAAACSQVYTYVVMPGELKCVTYTGLSFVGEFSSKHAVMSAAATEVLYAGDLFVLDDVLYLTNNSGTYRPREEGLERVCEMLRGEFEGLSVVGLSVRDARFADIMKKVHPGAPGVGRKLLLSSCTSLFSDKDEKPGPRSRRIS